MPAYPLITTPDEGLRALRDGNARFVAGAPVARDLPARVAQIAPRQQPFAAVLGCIDSRVPPEIVFDQRMGDLFCVRVAGNSVSAEVLGGLEFATEVAGACLIVVLGHTACGAVRAACAGVELGHVTHAIAPIQSAVAARRQGGDQTASDDPSFVDAVAEDHVRGTAALLRARSPILDRRCADDRLLIAGAMYDVASGRVTFLP